MLLFVSSAALVHQTDRGPAVTPAAHVTVATTRDEANKIASNAIAIQNTDKRIGSIATHQVPDAMIRDQKPLYLSSVVMMDRNSKVTSVAHVQHANSVEAARDAAREAFGKSHPDQKIIG